MFDWNDAPDTRDTRPERFGVIRLSDDEVARFMAAQPAPSPAFGDEYSPDPFYFEDEVIT